MKRHLIAGKGFPQSAVCENDVLIILASGEQWNVIVPGLCTDCEIIAIKCAELAGKQVQYLTQDWLDGLVDSLDNVKAPGILP